MIKVCFLSWHFATPQIYLDSIRKMTPGNKGVWKDMVAVTNPFEADFCAIMDGYSGNFPQDRAIYFGEHPDCCPKSFRTFEDKKALARISLDKYINPGEWWIKYDYDTLVSLPSIPKPKDLICVMTYQTHTPMYSQRPKFMQALVHKYPDIPLTLHGRPIEMFNNDELLLKYYKGPLGFTNPNGALGQHLIGKEVIGNYKYSLEFDVGPTRNYFSERFYDALLLWTCPIYFGSNNVHEYIPLGAFKYIDINNLSDVDRVNEYVTLLPDIVNMAEARDLLLNKYQLWPYIYGVIKSL